jgi:hypothetical protein
MRKLRALGPARAFVFALVWCEVMTMIAAGALLVGALLAIVPSVSIYRELVAEGPRSSWPPNGLFGSKRRCPGASGAGNALLNIENAFMITTNGKPYRKDGPVRKCRHQVSLQVSVQASLLPPSARIFASLLGGRCSVRLTI